MHVFQPVELDEILEGAFKFGGETWALLTAGKDDKVNAMTISWGGLVHVWDKTCAVFFVRESRYTRELMDASKKVSVSFLHHENYKDLKGYLGSVSGRDENKIEKANLNVSYWEDIPYINEADNVIVCKILFKQLMTEESFVSGRLIADHYRNGDFHYTYIAEIKQVLIR